jgi:quaternary ammonium compound-resistance protein SugE
MSWLYMLLAGMTEISWPIGLKMAQSGESKVTGIAVAIFFMTISGMLLWLAQKEIPMGTAYAVWTGIGASGTFLIGIWLYGDPTSLTRYLGVLFIILGVVVLKFAH